jgi:predicted lipoprotein with Yx(FWY)xxD motif
MTLSAAGFGGLADVAGGAGMGAAGAAATSTHTVHISTTHVKHIGTVLTTAGGLTLYYYSENPTGQSTCTGVCAKLWPPMLAAKGAHIQGPHGVRSLSLIKVGTNRWQVAFHHEALYRFSGDKKKGQAKGQGVEGSWFAAMRSGIPAAAPVTTTTSTAPATTTTQTPQSTTSTTHAPIPVPTPTTLPAPTTTPTTAAPPPTTTPTTQPPPPTTTTTTGGGYGY